MRHEGVQMIFYTLRRVALLLVLFALTSAAHAQTGSTKTQGQLNSEINTLWPDNITGQITPFNARQTLLDMVASGPGAVGMVGDGTTDNQPAFQALLTAVGTSGGSINLPCGNFVIKSATSFTVAGGKQVTIAGQGLCTILSFQGTAATAITLGNLFSSIHWGHMRMTTDGAGTHIGITASMPVMSAGPVFPVHHIFEDIQFTGDDYAGGTPAHYWSTGLQISGLSTVDINDVASVGIASRVGTGVSITGNVSGAGFSTIINFKNYNAIHSNIGIMWGSYTQGISVIASNFQSGNFGILSDNTGVGLSELVITNSQFGDNTAAGIEVGGNVGELGVSNSLFEMGSGQVGIIGTGFDFKIVGNSFLAQSAGSGIGVGIAMTSPNGFGTISANSFTNLLSGINADSGSTYASVMITLNMHAGTTTPYNFSGGTNLLIDDIQPIGVASLPTCNSTIQGSLFTVTNNNTAAAYRGAVTAGGALWGRVFCPSTGAWVQN